MKRPAEVPTYVLQERTASTCHLRRQDVDFLLAEHRAHVELLPAGRGGYYRLTPKGHVGTMVCPTCRLVIRPKIPTENLFYLLDPTAPIPASPDQTTPLPLAEGLDFLAGRLAQLLHERATAGLHRGYLERSERRPFLQGQLDLPAHLRGRNNGKDQLHCRFEEFTTDLPCNQIPKATAKLVLQSQLLGEGLRLALRRSLQAFTSVTLIPIDRDCFSAARIDRLTEAYRPLFDLCWILVESLAPGEQFGSTSCPTFLLDMDRVFERYVTTAVARGFAGSSRFAVSVQPLLTINRPDAGLPDIQLRPDFTVADHGSPFLVGDAKWKRVTGSPLVTSDLYQVLSYCTALGIKHGLLVYPGGRDRLWSYSLSRAPLGLDICTLCVTGRRECCNRSLGRLTRWVRDARAALRSAAKRRIARLDQFQNEHDVEKDAQA
jgi:5-methylcytosine-specific restriction enzyme subunit McrC